MFLEIEMISKYYCKYYRKLAILLLELRTITTRLCHVSQQVSDNRCIDRFFLLPPHVLRHTLRYTCIYIHNGDGTLRSARHPLAFAYRNRARHRPPPAEVAAVVTSIDVDAFDYDSFSAERLLLLSLRKSYQRQLALTPFFARFHTLHLIVFPLFQSSSYLHSLSSTINSVKSVASM